MKFPFYTSIYGLVLILALPYYLVKGLRTGKYLEGLRGRAGMRPFALGPKTGPRVWVHALSLGETLTALALVNRLLLEGYDVCMSATTRSGIRAAEEKVPPGVEIIPFPLDLPSSIRRIVRKAEPDLFVLVETDIWPNLLAHLHKKDIPAILVNAKVSAGSFARFKLIGWWWKRVLHLFAAMGAQTEIDKQRLLSLGADPERVLLTGNIKFDGPRPSAGPDARQALLAEAGLPPGQWLVAGSTHEGEDEVLLDILARLRPEFPDLRLLLAPRNRIRFEPVWRLIKKSGLSAARRTGSPPDLNTRVFLLDTQGELARFYEVADLVFIGKSLAGPGEGGGHNPLEPAIKEKPLIFGSRMYNFEDISALLLSAGGAVQAADRDELLNLVSDLLSDNEKRRHMGLAARRVVESHQGALDSVMGIINKIMDKENQERS
ncbi:MAG: 3-deoxy-D-manno-octulosonic acid transferase [Deltaproteobacteria bacterium]|nr:3-deoxy-D-manno-octulosonic acid transferase [Deltaproteobacteria bacterium]